MVPSWASVYVPSCALRVPPQHLPARAGGGGGHQQQQRVRLRLPGQRPQLQPLHLQAQRQVLQRAGRQGAAVALPQVEDDARLSVGRVGGGLAAESKAKLEQCEELGFFLFLLVVVFH